MNSSRNNSKNSFLNSYKISLSNSFLVFFFTNLSRNSYGISPGFLLDVSSCLSPEIFPFLVCLQIFSEISPEICRIFHLYSLNNSFIFFYSEFLDNLPRKSFRYFSTTDRSIELKSMPKISPKNVNQSSL